MNARKQRKLIELKRGSTLSGFEQESLNKILTDLKTLREKAIDRVAPPIG